MMPSQQDFLEIIKHEKNHKRFIFVCGAIAGIVVSYIFFLYF